MGIIKSNSMTTNHKNGFDVKLQSNEWQKPPLDRSLPKPPLLLINALELLFLWSHTKDAFMIYVFIRKENSTKSFFGEYILASHFHNEKKCKKCTKMINIVVTLL